MKFSLRKGLLGRVRRTLTGSIVSTMKPHHPTNELLVERTQLDREIILERTARRRIEEATRPLDWAHWALTIPTLDYRRLIARNPELASPDRETRNRAWRRFIASPESAPYRVTDRA